MEGLSDDFAALLGWEIWDETIRMTGYRNNINVSLYINLYF
jgi:hypothetical protein